MSEAWLIKLNTQQQCAIAIHEFKEILQTPELHILPLGPKHCKHLTSWGEHIVPIINFDPLLNNTAYALANEYKVGILAYQTEANTALHYGGVFIEQQPQRIQVNDEQACALPEGLEFWQSWSIACFEHEEIRTPILDLSQVYATTLDTHVNVPY